VRRGRASIRRLFRGRWRSARLTVVIRRRGATTSIHRFRLRRVRGGGVVVGRGRLSCVPPGIRRPGPCPELAGGNPPLGGGGRG
jgi:hypothetical protein